MKKIVFKTKVKKATKATKVTSQSNIISRTTAVNMIKQSGGKFFTVTFIKNNGTTRTINCNARKNCQNTLGYINVYSPNEKGYKNINPLTIKSLSISGRTYKVK